MSGLQNHVFILQPTKTNPNWLAESYKEHDNSA